MLNKCQVGVIEFVYIFYFWAYVSQIHCQHPSRLIPRVGRGLYGYIFLLRKGPSSFIKRRYYSLGSRARFWSHNGFKFCPCHLPAVWPWAGYLVFLIIICKMGIFWTSLVAQWLRICLPMQGTRVQALVREDPICCGATKPMHHNYWVRVPQLLKPVRLEPAYHNEEQPPLFTTRESSCAATKTQHSHK